MSQSGRRMRLLRALALALVVCLWSPAQYAASDPPAGEIRALWVLRTSLASPDSITALVRLAREHGFNTLLVQVRGRGDSYFARGIEPRAAELRRQADAFDPLAMVLQQAHAAGLRVHAWVNVNLVSSAADLPAAREHLVHRNPEWLMVPRDIAQDLATVDSASPAYVGKIARWTRSQSDVEGLYSSPAIPEAVSHTASVVRDLVKRYKVDGVHFDYARYPTERFDYSRGAIRHFRASVRPTLPDAQRRQLDAAEDVDLFAYPDAFPAEWRRFRTNAMTSLMTRLSATVRDQRPGTTVTVAAAPDMREALERRLQDWSAWLAAGTVDAICPMAYTQEAARFAEQIAAAREVAGARGVWAGIGAYRLTPAQTIDNINTARRLGANGVILFSYDSIVNQQKTVPDYLDLVSRAAFADSRPNAGSR